MTRRNLSEGTPQSTSWKRHLRTIARCDSERLRSAIEALVADGTHRAAILPKLLQIVSRFSDIACLPIPDGLATGEEKKYREMVRAATIQHAATLAALGIVGPDGLLDDVEFVQAIDRSGMLNRLAQWPEHVTTMRSEAMKAVLKFKATYGARRFRKIQVFGVGGSGAPHDIAAQVIRNSRKSRVHVQVIHADQPDVEDTDEDTLAVLSSFSGNTEETLHCYKEIRGRAGALVALGQGGELRRLAKRDGFPFIQLPDNPTHPAFVLQPRESACLQMTAMLAFLAGLGLPAGSKGRLTLQDLDLDTAVSCLESWRQRLEPSVPYRANRAKRLAAFLLYGVGADEESGCAVPDLWDKRTVFVLADRNNAALAHEVRTQLHERSKLNAACYEAPECLHNLVESIRATAESSRAGLEHDRWVYYFIRSSDEKQRVAVRLDKTIELVMRGRATFATLRAEGANPLHRALFATYFNAYMTTYLALLNGFDPLPVPTMSWLKKVMEGVPRRRKPVTRPTEAGAPESLTFHRPDEP